MLVIMLGAGNGLKHGILNDFAGTATKSNFLCSLGYGDPAGLFPRSPRFSFAEIAKIL